MELEDPGKMFDFEKQALFLIKSCGFRNTKYQSFLMDAGTNTLCSAPYSFSDEHTQNKTLRIQILRKV